MLADLLTNSGVYDQVAYISIALQTENMDSQGNNQCVIPFPFIKYLFHHTFGSDLNHNFE